MEDVRTRKITLGDNDGLSVTRYRDSNGYAYIKIKYDDDEIILYKERDYEDESYEQIALNMAKLIGEIANNSCLLD